MKYLYPKFNNATHVLVGQNIPSSDKYPSEVGFDNRKDHALSEGLVVCAVDESLGYKCEWSQVLVIDPIFSNTGLSNTPIYVKNENLQSVGGKETFLLDETAADTIKQNAADIDPTLKEIFTPYVDYKNGLYSIRIQTDYEKALESFLLENLLEAVYYEGIQLLLDSKGYRSDNATIDGLINKYYTFAYINDDLDQTVTRRCEPLTFTVSIPLRFFSKLPPVQDIETDESKITKTLTLTNKTFKDDINKVMRSLTSRTGDIIALTYPNYFIKNFVLDFEIASLKMFVNAANELFAVAEFPLQSDDIIEYDLGFDDSLVLQGIKAFRGGKEYKFNNALVSQARMRAEFNSKRIFNYLFNRNNMVTDAQNMDILQYLEKYVAYEKIALIDEPVYVNGKQLSPEKARQYNTVFAEAQEECLSSTFLKGTANDAITAVFSDPIYHLFVKTKDEKTGQEAPKKSLWANVKDGWSGLQTDFKTIANSENPKVDYKVALSETRSGFKEALLDTSAFPANINTVLYILNRLNINKILFEKVFCILKGVDPNDPNNVEIAQLIAQLPADIINYMNYYDTIKDLKGAEYAKAVVNGLPLDSKLFCTKNADLIYFLKGLSTILKTYNMIGSIRTRVSDAAKAAIEAAGPRKESPYVGFGKSLGKTLQQTLVNALFDMIKDLLLASCDDPTLNDATQYQSPYDTHNPISGINDSQQTNNDKAALVDNRGNALTKVYDPLQYGFDREYVVDLLQLLFNDINCILTPQESIDLLSGVPSELVITLVKNIIKKKYSTPESDLTFLLSDNNKLLLFFRELGMTVDKDILVQIVNTISNPASPATLCSPQQQSVREEIINGKIPKELGVLERQLRTRSIKAKQLFDRAVDGTIVLDVKPFCPDTQGQEYEEAVSHLKENYAQTIDQTFVGVLTSFNNEAEMLTKDYIDRKSLIRKDGRTIIGTVEYNLFNEDLALNLLQPETSLKKVGEQTTLTLKYLPKSLQETSKEDLTDAITGASEEEESVTVTCLDANKAIDYGHELYNKFITNDMATTSFFVRFHIADDVFEGTDLQEIYHETGGVLSDELRKRDTFIVVDIDRELVTANEVNIKLIYNDSDNGRFLILKNINFDGVIQDKTYSSQGFSNEFDAITKEWQIYRKNAQDVYFIQTGVFNNLPPRAKNLLISAYDQYFKPFMARLETLKATKRNIELFNENGIFSIDTVFSDKLTKNIYSTTFDEKLNSSRKLLFSLEQSERNDGYQENIELFTKVLYNNFVKNSQQENYFKYSPDTNTDFLRIDEKGNQSPLSTYSTSWYNLWDDEGIQGALKDKEVIIVENTDPSKNKYLNSYSKYSLYHFKKSMNYKNCNTNPHYLNFDFFKTQALNSFTEELCKTGPDATQAIEEVIVNLMFRTFISDLLIKSIPYWQTGTVEQFKEIYKHQEYIDILKEFLKLEMAKYNPYPPGTNDNFLYDEFVKVAVRIYDPSRRKRAQELLVQTDDSAKQAIEYFIKREIKHFIDYSLYFSIIKFSDKTFVEYYKNGLDDSVNSMDSKVTEFSYFGNNHYLAAYNGITFINTPYKDSSPNIKIKQAEEYTIGGGAGGNTSGTALVQNIYDKKYFKYLEAEYKYGLIYFLLSANTKASVAEQFANTRSELVRLLGRYIKSTQPGTDLAKAFDNSSVDTNRLNSFLNNLAYSPSPAAMIALNPNYSKYIKFFMQAAIDNSRAFALNQAQQSDPNIKLTRAINMVTTVTGLISWSLMSQKTRQSLILNSNDITSLLIYKRLEDGRSITPDLVTSLGITVGSLGTLTPGVAGWTYLALDSINEAQYYSNSLEEIRKLKGLKGNEDPCSPSRIGTESGGEIDPSCNPDKQKKLTDEINSFEPEKIS
jgi:hypothetical protein